MYYVVKSLEMTNFLVRQGHDIQKVDDARHNPEFKVFLFRDSKELRDSITMFTYMKNQKSSK